LQISTTDVWTTIASEAGSESRLWGDALRPENGRESEAVFSPLGEERFGLGLETIYEGYLVHYGRPRLFEPADADTALLLGTISTRTGSSGSRRSAASRPSPTWPS